MLYHAQYSVAKLYVTDNGKLLLLLDGFLYGLKQSPLKFQRHLSQTLSAVGYKQSIHDECLFYKNDGHYFSYVSTHSDELLHCVNKDVTTKPLKNM